MRNRSISYRPEIDGLRAIAVIPVLLYHARVGLSGGFVGVDIFFVISGFLIASMVIVEIEAGSFKLVDFWERRIRRLFPALAAIVIACLIAGVFVFESKHLKYLGQSISLQSLLCSNFYFWRMSSAGVPDLFLPLQHTWSLAVEEQFYLFFPPVFLILMQWSRRVAMIGVLAFVIASLGWSVYASASHPTIAFFLIPSRIWELSIGVLLALLPKRKLLRPVMDEAISWIGLLMILYSIFFFDVNARFPGWIASIPCLGTAFIIYGNSVHLTIVGQILKQKPLVFVGAISYSLYLIHWPVIVFLKYIVKTDVPTSWVVASLFLSFLLAWLSWRFIETPFRVKRVFPVRKHLFIFSACLSLLFVVIGLLLYER